MASSHIYFFLFLFPQCPGFSWDRINFLHSSWYGVCFGFLIKTLVIMHHSFSCCRAVLPQTQGLSASHAAAPEWRLGMQEIGSGQSQNIWPKLTRVTRVTLPGKLSLSQPMSFLAFAVPEGNCPREYPILCCPRGEWLNGCVGAWLLAGVNPQHFLNCLQVS